MVKEDQNRRPGRGPAFQAAAVLLALFSLSATGFLMLRWLRTDTEQPAGASGPGYFLRWPKNAKPDLVVLLTGQMHGYTLPCGCSDPQYGGLERRYNLLQKLKKERGWPFAALDLGDIAQERGPQALLKYAVSMKALKIMDYSAIGLGLNELNMPLLAALAEYTLNDKDQKPRILAANLKKDNLADMVADYQIVGTAGQPRIGVTGVIGRSVIKENKDRSLEFFDKEGELVKVVKRVLGKLAQEKVDLRVLLYSGGLEDARKCAKLFPEFDVIFYESPEEEPRGDIPHEGNTLLITTGHKGRNVGFLGIYRTGQANKPFDLHYDHVLVGPEYATPAGQAKEQPILQLMEEYARTVRAKNYLEHYPKTKHPIQAHEAFKDAVYVGSDACKSCHKEAYEIWKKTPHSHAYDTLVKAEHPSLRQFDGECVKCHVTGFDYLTGFRNAKETPKLVNVGCENCHGPGSIHVKNQNVRKTDAALNALMNPFRPRANEKPEDKAKRMVRLADACRHCHDDDNDVHWDEHWQIKKWAKIEHHETKE